MRVVARAAARRVCAAERVAELSISWQRFGGEEQRLPPAGAVPRSSTLHNVDYRRFGDQRRMRGRGAPRVAVPGVDAVRRAPGDRRRRWLSGARSVPSCRCRAVGTELSWSRCTWEAEQLRPPWAQPRCRDGLAGAQGRSPGAAPRGPRSLDTQLRPAGAANLVVAGGGTRPRQNVTVTFVRIRGRVPPRRCSTVGRS